MPYFLLHEIRPSGTKRTQIKICSGIIFILRYNTNANIRHQKFTNRFGKKYNRHKKQYRTQIQRESRIGKKTADKIGDIIRLRACILCHNGKQRNQSAYSYAIKNTVKKSKRREKKNAPFLLPEYRLKEIKIIFNIFKAHN